MWLLSRSSGARWLWSRPGDLITLDVAARELSLNVAERTLAGRREQWQPPAPKFERGYGALFSEHITQANQGCDFGFLARRGRNPSPTRGKRHRRENDPGV